MPAATDAHAAARPKKEEKSWTCPYCELQIIQDPEARADQLSRKRLHHIRTAHPDKPQPNVCKRRQAIEASNALPDTLKAWVCPICYAALPELEERLKHDSICKHITDHHPKETLRSLNSKQARAKLPPGTVRTKHLEPNSRNVSTTLQSRQQSNTATCLPLHQMTPWDPNTCPTKLSSTRNSLLAS